MARRRCYLPSPEARARRNERQRAYRLLLRAAGSCTRCGAEAGYGTYKTERLKSLCDDCGKTNSLRVNERKEERASQRQGTDITGKSEVER
jgi:hypothetical protein